MHRPAWTRDQRIGAVSALIAACGLAVTLWYGDSRGAHRETVQASLSPTVTAPEAAPTALKQEPAAVITFERRTTGLSKPAPAQVALERVFARSAVNTPGVVDVGVLVVDEQGEVVGSLVAISTRVLTSGNRRASSPFTHAFVGLGLHRMIFEGLGAETLEEYGAAAVTDELLLGFLSERYTPVRGEREGLITADLALTMRLVSARLGSIQVQYDFHARGVGFSEGDAKRMAMERLSQDVAERLSGQAAPE